MKYAHLTTERHIKGRAGHEDYFIDRKEAIKMEQ